MNKRLEDIVGLDWSDGRIVAARVDASPLGAVRLLNVGWADVPADAADDVVAAAIKKVWHSAGMPSRTVAVALRGRSVVVRPFDYSSLHPEEFHLFSADEYIDLVIDYVEHLRPDMVVERFVSQSPKDLLIAPDWGLKNYEFVARLQKRMKERGAYQGKKYRDSEKRIIFADDKLTTE